MQLNEASLMLPEGRGAGSGEPRPLQKVLIRFSGSTFQAPLWLGVTSGQWLLAATENSFFSYSGPGPSEAQERGGLRIPALG